MINLEKINIGRKILKTDYIHVIDDFFDFPVELDKYIQESEFVREDSAMYGGRTLKLTDYYNNFIHDKIERILGVKNIQGYGRARMTSHEDDGTDQTFIHLDFNCLVLIIYLSDVSHTENVDEKATSFYFHKFLKRKKISDQSQAKDFLTDNIIMENYSSKYEQWEKWQAIEPKNNRAIIFDGHLFHSGPRKYSGVDKVHARITIDYFFNRNLLLEQLK